MEKEEPLKVLHRLLLHTSPCQVRRWAPVYTDVILMSGQMTIPGVSNNKERLTAFIHRYGALRASHHSLASASNSFSEGFSTLSGLFLQLPHTSQSGQLLGQTPERAPRFYGVFVFSVYPLHKCWPTATAKRAPETTSMWAAAEQRDVLTFHPELQLDLERKQKYSHVYFFFPEMIIIVLQTSTTKMEKALQKIIY